jgi:hypothetical protein
MASDVMSSQLVVAELSSELVELESPEERLSRSCDSVLRLRESGETRL